MDETTDSATAPGNAESGSPAGSRRARTWLIVTSLGLAVWAVLGLVVLSWQPSRLTQLALVIGIAAAALLVPGSILQETNCGYHILGGVADDVQIDFS